MLKRLIIVCIDNGVAMALTTLLAASVLVVVVLAGPGQGAAAHPWASSISYELRIDDPSSAPLAALIDRLNSEFSTEPTAFSAEVARRDGTLWLDVWLRDPRRGRAVTARIQESGLASNRLILSSNWQRRLGELATDPLDALTAAAWLLPVLMACTPIGLLAAAVLFRRLRPAPGYEAPPPSWAEALPRGVALGVVGATASGIVSTVAARLGLHGEEQEWILELASGNALAVAGLAVLAVCVAPISEELFYRGHVFRYIASTDQVGLAYIASAILFSMTHFNPGATPGYVIAALVLGWSYQRWRSLRIPVIAHATWNAVGVTLLLTS